MAIQFFRISRNAVRVDVLKDSVAIVVDESHPIAEESEISIDNNSGFKGEFLDSIGYQVSEDGITWSNEGNIDIKELVLENTPQSSNQVQAAAVESDYVMDVLLPVNTSTDRIKITNIEGYGLLTNNNNQVFIGNEFFLHLFSLLSFETKKGGGIPYATISYICGNHVGYNTNDTYTVIFNVATLGEINFVNSDSVTGTVVIGGPVYGYTSVTEEVIIENAFVNKQVKINVIIDSDMLDENANSFIKITYDNVVIQKFADETFDIETNAGSKGTLTLFIEHYHIDESATPVDSNVTLEITEVDEDLANVNPGNKQYVSIANFGS